MSEPLDLHQVALFLRQFADDRDWDQFHTPKNLSMALAGEAGELLEIFQWLTPEQSESLSEADLEHTGQELVDIIQYVVRMSDVLGIDLAEAFESKFIENETRYPAEEVRGSAEKRIRS